jgi:hypothetical protein
MNEQSKPRKQIKIGTCSKCGNDVKGTFYRQTGVSAFECGCDDFATYHHRDSETISFPAKWTITHSAFTKGGK